MLQAELCPVYGVLTPAAEEPLTIAEVRRQLRLDVAESDLSTVVSLAPDNYASGTTNGSTVTVDGFRATATLTIGDAISGGTATVKLQESLNGSAWTDVTGGGVWTPVAGGSTVAAFGGAAVNAAYYFAYTGDRPYLRAVITGAGSGVQAGCVINLQPYVDDEDAEIARIISTVTDDLQKECRRQFVTASLALYLDRFPDCHIAIERCPLLAVSALKYIDTAGVQQTMSPSLYTVDAKREPGRIFPAYGTYWPCAYETPNAVTVEFTAGYGTASSVPAIAKSAMLIAAAEMYLRRAENIVGTIFSQSPMLARLAAKLDWGG